MRNQLLQNEEKGEKMDDEYKTVRLYMDCDIFAGNDRADVPIFKKSDLRYDKYELSKLISFQNFQLLMRPFKNDPAFKRCIFWKKIINFLIVLMVLVTLCAIPVIILSDDLLLLIWAISYTVMYLILGCVYLRRFYITHEGKKAFLDYCLGMNLYNEKITISAIKRPDQTVKILITDYFYISYLEIKSHEIIDDERSIKLYHQEGIFYNLSLSLQKPIFGSRIFEFNSGKLDKIISFEDLQILIRPFKENEMYKKIVYYIRCLYGQMLMFCIVLFLPLFRFESIIVNICIVAYVFLAFSIFLLIGGKAKRVRGDVIKEFVQYCKQVNRHQQRVEIIPHLKENSQLTELYCIQVKRYEQ